MSMPYGLGSHEEVGHFDGTVPVHYRVQQSLHQWEPVLNRTFWLSPPPPGVALNWAALDDDIASGRTAAVFRSSLFGRLPITAEMSIYKNTDMSYVASPIAFVPPHIVRALCSSDTGLFDWVSAIAPTGGNNFEDAAVWDPSDPRETLVVVIVENGDDIVMYRRLYHGN
jgi:hypothetical protein